MPKRPLRPCPVVGCPALTRGGRCDKHKARPADVDRPSASGRGYDRRWRKARDTFLAMNPLCAMCQANGLVEVATVVDHVKPHRGNPEVFWDFDNWQGLCTTCHNKKTRKGE